MTTSLLHALNLFKSFGGLLALENVSFSIEPGEVLGVVGRRSSGKSVLLHLLAGAYPPTTGQLHFQGRPLHSLDRCQARRLGIELVPQTPLLVTQLDVLSNIFLGRETSWLTRDWPRMTQRAKEVLRDLDAPDSLLRQPVHDLSEEQKQVVAIGRALCRPARLILLDDALASLSFQRQEVLLALIKTLAGRGVSFIITSDTLNHLFAVTDRILVLFEGRLVADRRTADSTPREIVELIVGAAGHEQVTPVIWALESYHAAQQQAEELRLTQARLRESLKARDSLNRELVERLRDQVGALDQLNVALRDAHRRLLTEREEERKHIARELHDQVIQDLLSFNYRLEEAEGQKSTSNHPEELAAIRSGIRQVVSDLRQLCSDLRPPTIDSHGLTAAIRSHAQQWADQNGVALTLDIDPQLGRLPEAIELSVFRIVQEGLNNVRKHARARHTQIGLRRTSTATLLVRVADDGRGMEKPPDLAALSAQSHFGLLGISERAALLGGTMQIDLPVAGGVVLEVEIPSPYPSVY